MIEKVMNERDTQSTIEVRIPKNIKQIGENNKFRKIYVEETVMTELNKKPQNEDKVRYGVLLGELKRSKGVAYVFVKGIAETKEIIENSIIFNDDIWAEIYKDIRQYYNGDEIVGWFANVPYTVNNELNRFKKIHLDNFAGNDKVCYISDRSEKEDGFFAYESGELKKQNGYYIFTEKNEKAKKYIHQSEKNTVGNNGVNGRTNDEKMQTKNVSFREMLKEQIEDNIKENNSRFGKATYVLSSFLIVALLLSTVVMMNNYGELKNLKTSIDNINVEDNLLAVNEMISSIVPADSEVKTKNYPDEMTNDNYDEIFENADLSDGETADSNDSEADYKKEEESNTQYDEEGNTDKASGASGSVYSGMYYTVKKGQTLYDISVKYYGDNSMVDEIKELNEIDDDYMIREGQTIVLP
ncbi:MAG: LysM peptidoglycan-binding domain-containing protein [Lachnospiraceae bacterium]|nr:LysM peptidoglycan-binding domain-containing protein [Lachnospiraceae bacterium]